METENHFIDLENHIYRTKIDLFKESGQMTRFKVVCWERVVKCHLDDENNPTFKVRKLEEDGKKMDVIRKDGQPISSEKWNEEEVYQLRMLFDETNGDIKKTSKN